MCSTSPRPLPEVGLFFGRHRQFHQRRAVGQADHGGLGIQGGWPGAPCLAAVRGGPGRPGAVHGAVDLHPQAAPATGPSGLFLLLYGLARFGIEFVRVPDANLGYLAADWVTMGQILSLPMILGGIVLLGHRVSSARAIRKFLVAA